MKSSHQPTSINTVTAPLAGKTAPLYGHGQTYERVALRTMSAFLVCGIIWFFAPIVFINVGLDLKSSNAILAMALPVFVAVGYAIWYTFHMLKLVRAQQAWIAQQEVQIAS
jgi:hypothetical protein